MSNHCYARKLNLELPLENEIKNLIIYKKALYNSDKVGENDLLNILNPLFNSNSILNYEKIFYINYKQFTISL